MCICIKLQVESHPLQNGPSRFSQQNSYNSWLEYRCNNSAYVKVINLGHCWGHRRSFSRITVYFQLPPNWTTLHLFDEIVHFSCHFEKSGLMGNVAKLLQVGCPSLPNHRQSIEGNEKVRLENMPWMNVFVDSFLWAYCSLHEACLQVIDAIMHAICSL